MSDKDEMYTPPPDRPLSYDVRADSDDKKGMMLLVIAAFLVVTFGAVVWGTFKSGVRDRDVPPYITASKDPFKVTPEDPGGLMAPNQDKTVYNTLSGEKTKPVESFAKGPEEPVDKAKLDKNAPKAAPAGEVKTANLDTTPKLKPAVSAPLKGSSQDEKPAAKPAPMVKAETEKPKTPAPATVTKVKTGGVAVQLASTPSQADADATWGRLAKKHTTLANYSKDIERADLGAKGIYYRVRAAGFETASDANAFCKKMKAAGQGCIVRK